MAAVWYIGQSDIRSISAAQWANAGISGVVGSVWDASNGWSIPKSSFTGAQIAILDLDPGFDVNGLDGPRPGDPDLPDDSIVADRAWVADQVTGLKNDLLGGVLVQNLRDYGAGHLANVQRERQSLGGPIGTGGKAVAAIRIDHNNKKFQEVLLPLLIARDIPASMCQFINAFTPDPGYTNDVSTGYGWTDVQNACLQHGIEVWNHSWSHQEVSTQAGYEREILDSKLELEARMTRIRVKGFMVPGVTGNNWGNFSNNLSNMDVWHTTEAGRLIMESHPAANGGGSQLQALNTGSTLGWQSRQIDNDTVSSTQINLIKSAQVQKCGIVTMIHPSMIDYGAGYITTTVLTEILDYMVAERDAGRLEILTITGMLHADTERTTRNNLIRDQGFTAATTYYVGTTGYTFSGGVATGNGTAGLLGQNINLGAQVAWAGGSTRMASVKIQATAGAVVRIRLYDLTTPSLFDVTKDVTLPASANWVTIRKAISLPTNGTANLRMDFGRVSGGAINIKEPAMEAV